jgi:hypothetical protein
LLKHARQRRGGAGIPAPVLTDSEASLGTTAEGWFDITVHFTFSGEAAAEAVVEVWEWDEVYSLRQVGAAPISDHLFVQTKVSEVYGTFYYRVRYRCGSVVGPFSNELAAVITT